MYNIDVEPITFAIQTPLALSKIKALSCKYQMPLIDLGYDTWKLKYQEDVWEEHWEMEPFPEGTCTHVLREAGSLIFLVEDNKVSYFEALNALLDAKCELDSLIGVMEWEFDIKIRTLSDHLNTNDFIARLIKQNSK